MRCIMAHFAAHTKRMGHIVRVYVLVVNVVFPTLDILLVSTA